MGSRQSIWFQPDLAEPEQPFVSNFDPMLGFPNGRKVRTVKTTVEEMESAQIPPDLRDYCIDYYMKYLECRQKVFPWNYKCAHEIHDYHNCQFQDHELRMKEYERERRLQEKLAKQEAED
ncbi:NADH dehydrogenase [ubiquinone] 1 beta subcomplex subunit 7 [Parasteatoda tepidariorum]|nr:NADH dehydrogenase [ubiquinone] 1 beta subcomplex subunit 7 [Parasteatoda tepidariorum]